MAIANELLLCVGGPLTLSIYAILAVRWFGMLFELGLSY
jgi:hypothetical protein